jgi:PAS domain S-box-containing protein
MNIYSIIPLIAFLFNSFVWVYIYAQKKDNEINYSFLLYAAFLSIWILIVFIIREKIELALIMPLMKIASIVWLSIVFLFMNFTYKFINKKWDIFFYGTLLFVIISIGLSLTTKLILEGYLWVSWGVVKDTGPLFMLVSIIVIIIPAFYCLILILEERRVTADDDLKKSLTLIFYGSLFSLTIGLISNIIIPVIFNYIEFPEIAESGTAIQSICIFIAVTKYRLFAISVEEIGESLFDNMNDVVILIDRAGRVLNLNSIGEIYFSGLLPLKRNMNINEIIEGFDLYKSYQNYESNIINNNEPKIILLTSSKIYERGKERGSIVIIRDITETKQAEEVIKKSEIKFRSIWQNSNDAMRLTDENGIIVDVNDSFCKLIEMERTELLGKPLVVTYAGFKDTNAMIENYKNRFLTRNFSINIEQKLNLRSGKVAIVQVTNSIVELEDKNLKLLAVFRDITEQKELQLKLAQAVHQRMIDLQNFASSLQKAQEEERIKISREIHDELGQVLTALKMDIVLLIENLVEKNVESDTIPELESFAGMIDELIQIVRNIATELRPDILDHFGLVAALEWQAKEFQKRNKIQCSFSTNLQNLNFEKDKCSAIYRIFQESLTNILRHSECTKVDVNFNLVADGKLILDIIDNGKGISKHELEDFHSIGIMGMKERSRFLNGDLIVKGKEGAGTEVRLEVPYLENIPEQGTLNPGELKNLRGLVSTSEV